MVRNYFHDVDDNGRLTPGMHQGSSLGMRVDERVNKKIAELHEKYKYGVSGSGNGYSEGTAQAGAKLEFERKVNEAVQAVFAEEEDEIRNFIAEGNETIGRFPEMKYNVFTFTSGRYADMNYFDWMNTPSWVENTRMFGLQQEYKRLTILRTLLRILLVLLGCAAYAAVLAVNDLHFWQYADLVERILPTYALQKIVPCIVWLVALGVYAYMLGKYHGHLSGKNFSLGWGGVAFFAMGLAVINWFFYPARVGNPDNMMINTIEVTGYLFGIFALLELRNLWQGLTARRKFVKRIKSQSSTMEYCDRLLSFHRLWYRSRYSGTTQNLERFERHMADIKDQYKRWS